MLDEISDHIGLALEKARSHHQYLRLYHDAQDPMFTINLLGDIVDANQAASRMSGYEREELRHMPITALIADQDTVTQVQKRVERAGHAERVPPLEFAMRCKDTSTRFFESNLTPIHDYTGVTAIQAIWRDVHLRRQAMDAMRRRNQQVNALLQITQNTIRPFEHIDLLSRVAEDIRVRLESDHGAVYLCEDPQILVEVCVSPPMHRHVSVTMAPPRLDESIIRQVASGERDQIANYVLLEEEPPYIPPSLGNSPQHVLTMPMKSTEGVVGVICVSRCGNSDIPPYTQDDKDYLELVANILALDVAYRRLMKAQSKQQAATTVLEQMDLVGRFLVHDVCGFLGAIGTTADLLYRYMQSSDPVPMDFMENLHRHGHTADRLVGQLRSMRKAAHQHVEVVSLKDVIETAAQIGFPPHIRLELGVLEFPSLRADRDLLIQVFERVFRNASEAMQTPGVLSIHGGVRYDRGEVWIDVSDTGHGIPPDIRKNLFEPFFSTKDTGLGIGLWSSRLYLQTLGGDIILTRTSSDGSTFTIRLPIVREMPNTSATPPLVATSTSASLEKEIPRREIQVLEPYAPHVLVVEDEPPWQGVIAPLLRLHGFQVQVATSATEALDFLEHQKYVAFVVDVRLDKKQANNMDGLEVVRHIQTRYALAPVLILSIWEDALSEAAQRYGDQQHIQIIDKAKREGLQAALAALATHLIPQAREQS